MIFRVSRSNYESNNQIYANQDLAKNRSTFSSLVVFLEDIEIRLEGHLVFIWVRIDFT
jgi:hypothetical protein